jgi:high-affinity K+ transport system ATPase subunit B
VQLIAIPALTIFYNLSLGPIASPLIAIALLAAIGLTTVGTLLSAMAIPCSSRRARSYIYSRSKTDERTPSEAPPLRMVRTTFRSIVT